MGSGFGAPLSCKHPSIRRMVADLRERLGSGAFDVQDHWEGDASAVGLAAPTEPGRLVYVSTFGVAAGNYDVVLELPPQPESDLPFATAGEHHSVDFDRLAELVAAHLRSRSS